MTAPALTFAQAVRDFIDLNVDSTSKYSDETINSNIRMASWMLERATNRLFGDYTGITRKYTTNGGAYLTIPGFRTITSATLAGSALTADVSYWLVPDQQQTGVYTGIQLRGFDMRTGGPSYLHAADWFDTNKDSPKWGALGSSQPNDLVLVGDAGYTDANLPEPARFATKVMAAFLTKYPDAVLVSSIATANDGTINLQGLPDPIAQFITEWAVPAGVQSA